MENEENDGTEKFSVDFLLKDLFKNFEHFSTQEKVEFENIVGSNFFERVIKQS